MAGDHGRRAFRGDGLVLPEALVLVSETDLARAIHERRLGGLGPLAVADRVLADGELAVSLFQQETLMRDLVAARALRGQAVEVERDLDLDAALRLLEGLE